MAKEQKKREIIRIICLKLQAKIGCEEFSNARLEISKTQEEIVR